MPTLATVAAVALCAAFALALVAVVARHTRTDLLHPLNLVAAIMAYYIVVPAAWLLVTGDYHFPNLHANRALELALALGVTGLSFLLLVGAFYRVGSGSRSQVIGTRLRTLDHDIDTNVLLVLGLFGFVVGLVCYLYYVLVNGGIVRFATITPRTTFQQIPNTGRFRFLGIAGLYAGLFVVYTALRGRFERRDLSQMGYALLVGCFVVVMSFAILRRSRMGILIPAAYTLLYFHTADRIPRRWIFGAGTVVVVFGIGFSFLESFVAGDGGGLSHLAVLVGSVFATIRLETIMETIVDVPANYPLQWGSTFLWILMWDFPWMPMRYSLHMVELTWGNAPPGVTFPAMMYGELWLNFWLVGVIVGSVVIGALLKAVYQARAIGGALAGGMYPLALLVVLVAIPTSIEYAITSVLFRLGIPVALAIAAAWVAGRVGSRTDAWASTDD